MADARTVLDMLVEADLATHIFVASDGINSISVHTDEQAAQRAVDALGVDPDMPFEKFARWLRYGKKADETKRLEHITGYTNPRFVDIWNSCLDTIKGDD